MAQPVVEVSNLSFRHFRARRPALEGVSLRLQPGEVLGVVGRTGAGKTTLLHCMAGIIPFYTEGRLEGEVRVLGKAVPDYGSLEALCTHVNVVLQDPESQLLNLYVDEELAWGLENFGLPAAEIRRRMARAVRALHIEHLLGRVTYTLSGGEKQLVVLAAMLALRPEILLLDEPTSELDPVGTERVFQAIRTLAQEGLSLVVVEHKVEALAEFAHRVALLHEGRLVRLGSAREVLTWEELPAYGLRPPQVSELARVMAQRGLPFSRPCLTLQEARAEGRRLLAGAGA